MGVSALISARESIAEAIGLCAIGPTLMAQSRTARDFGLFNDGKAICACAAGIKDTRAMGPRIARDHRIITIFYWNQSRLP